jgi:hypothetical protein
MVFKSEKLLVNFKNMLDKAPVNDIPQAPTDVPTPDAENIESQKLEWGPDLDEMSWYDAQKKIAELNEGLEKGEKPWRLPTIGELKAEYKKTNSTPPGFHGILNKTTVRYWSCTSKPGEDL